MNLHRRTFFLVLIAVCMVIGLPYAAPAAAQEADPAAPAATLADGYGYTLQVIGDDEAGRDWVDLNASNATKVEFCVPPPGPQDPPCYRDDAYAGPFDMFSFRFYESAPYDEFFVSTNGIVTFEVGESDYFARPLPFPPTPNNMIAPLWADLYKGTIGSVYYRIDADQNGQRLVIEWEIYNIQNPTVPITNFEVMLHQNGDIVFQYNRLNTVPDWYSVGIEDANGLNGLQHQTAVAVGHDLLFTRPGNARRVNIQPRMQGSFASGGEAVYPLKVMNNGDFGADNYSLQISNPNPQWITQFVSSTGAALTDTNGDGKADTGSVGQGEDVAVALKVKPLPGAAVGTSAAFIVTAASNFEPSRFITTTVQTAVPAAFAQVYVDNWGIKLGQYWKDHTLTWPVQQGYPGTSLSMEMTSMGNYVVAWEEGTSIGADGRVTHGVVRGRDGSVTYRGRSMETDASAKGYTDIKYRPVNRVTGPSGAVMTLTNGAQQVALPEIQSADARNPVLAPTINGAMAVSWSWLLRRTTAVPGQWEHFSNIYLAIIDYAGNPYTLPLNVTMDGGFYGYSHQYDFPQIAVIPDANPAAYRYVVCWIEQFSSRVRCGYHVLNYNLLVQLGIAEVGTTPQDVSPLDLFVTNLSGGRILVSYTESHLDASNQLVFVVLNHLGGVNLGRTVIADATGGSARAVEFPNGNILFAWIDEGGQVAYRYYGPNFAPLTAEPVYLPKISQRTADGLSLTVDNQGRAVMTWVDNDGFDWMFYAMLDQNGLLVTPTTVFLSAPFDDLSLQTSNFGFGNSVYSVMYRDLLPWVTP